MTIRYIKKLSDYEMSNPIRPKDIFGVFIMTITLLLIPFIAMQSTKQVDWQAFDFLIFGALIALAGLAIMYIARKISRASIRNAIIFAIVITFVLTWGELGVGIFGTPFAGD